MQRLMYHSAPAICIMLFFCNMMQKIFLSSISANRKTAGGENQWNFSRKSLFYKQGQFALESNDIMTACKIQMTSSRFQNIKAILPAHIKMQKLQPNTSDLVFFKALISTERWRHFFHQQTVNHIFVGNMLRVKKSCFGSEATQITLDIHVEDTHDPHLVVCKKHPRHLFFASKQ